MKIYQVLGILWLLNSCYNVYVGISVLPTVFAHAGLGLASLMYWLVGLFLMLDLVSIVASIYLIRGARWARWFLAAYAVLCVITAVGDIGRSFSILDGMFGIFALGSAILLLMPRRYVAA